jgi:hypothetical protein
MIPCYLLWTRWYEAEKKGDQIGPRQSSRIQGPKVKYYEPRRTRKYWEVVKEEEDSSATRTLTTEERGETAECKDMRFERDSRKSITTPTIREVYDDPQDTS